MSVDGVVNGRDEREMSLMSVSKSEETRGKREYVNSDDEGLNELPHLILFAHC